MNVAILSGNLTADIELRFSPTGMAIANFTVANNRRWKDKDGELKEKASFISVSAFGRDAENVAKMFKKGSPILVQGRLEQDSWEDKETKKKRSKTQIVMSEWAFMERKESGDAPRQSAPPSRPVTAGVPTGSEPVDSMPPEEDDVPF